MVYNGAQVCDRLLTAGASLWMCFQRLFPNVHSILLGSIAFLFLNITLDIYFGQFWYLRKYDDDFLIPLGFAPKGVIKE